MSSSLISCVRENSPPLKYEISSKERTKINSNTLPAKASPSIANTMADGQEPANPEQNKKRRFHPLRNLRRFFRRRTVTGEDQEQHTPPKSTSEKNLRSKLFLSSKAAPASSPASPLTHDQLNEAYSSRTFPKSMSCSSAIQNKKHETLERDQNLHSCNSRLKSNTASHIPSVAHELAAEAMQPTTRTTNLFIEKQKMSSGSDSTQDKEHTNKFTHSTNLKMGATSRLASDNGTNADISDNQRSLSEGRLLESGYGHEGFSQSHDSVFSETATTSSVSIGLRAELADVLRKRRNRQDTSEEDLGLPSSPITPIKTNEKYQQKSVNNRNSSKAANQSDLSLLSLNSVSEEAAGKSSGSTTKTSYVENSVQVRTQQTHHFSRTTTISTNSGSKFDELENLAEDGPDLSQTHSAAKHRIGLRLPSRKKEQGKDVNKKEEGNELDEIDSINDEGHNLSLSHSAARHRMAVRPTNRKKPHSIIHRRTLDIATSIPESFEDTDGLFSSKKSTETLVKSSTLPWNMTGKSLAEQLENKEVNKKTATKVLPSTKPPLPRETTKALKESLGSPTKAKSPPSPSYTKPPIAAAAASPVSKIPTPSPRPSIKAKDLVESLEENKNLLLSSRSSKRTIASTKGEEEENDLHMNEPKKIILSTPDANKPSQGLKSSVYIEQGKSDGTFSLPVVLDKDLSPKKEFVAKFKSGPAARQRYLPKELDSETSGGIVWKSNLTDSNKTHQSYETFESTELVREFSKFKEQSTSSLNSLKLEKHFEKKPKVIGSSPFQQKLTRSSEFFESANLSSNSNSSMETSTDCPLDYYEEKQRNAVEKSKSFRTSQNEEYSSKVHRNMPSLPDLSLSIRVPVDSSYPAKVLPKVLPHSEEEKCVSLGFEINDNNLLKSRNESVSFPNPGHDKNIILTSPLNSKLISSKILEPSADKEISEIEENIDKIVKSPFISVLKMEEKQRPERPKTLLFQEKKDEKPFNSSMTPSTAAVPLREKFKTKDQERNSAPVVSSGNPLTDSNKFSRRCASMFAPASNETSSNVPEFMKIQLNRVDPERVIRPNVVLAKTPNQGDQSPAKVQKASVVTPSPIPSNKSPIKTLKTPEDLLYVKPFASKETKTELQASPNFIANEISSGKPKVFSPPHSETNNLDSKLLLNELNHSKNLISQSHQNQEAAVKTSIVSSPVKVYEEALKSNGKSSPFAEFSTKKEAFGKSLPTAEVLAKPPSLARKDLLNSKPQESVASPTKVTSPEKKPFKVSGFVKTFPGLSSPVENENNLNNAKKIEETLPAPVLSSPEKVLPKVEGSGNEVVGRLSLQERKRLFMASELKEEKEASNEKKKSISDEMSKKLQKAANDPSVKSPPLSPLSTPSSPNENSDSVILRKKSLISSPDKIKENDSTPELMKVFARRSLKLKDEDIQTIHSKMGEAINNFNAVNGSNGLGNANALSPRKAVSLNNPKAQPNIDSDKENQYASEEKLDKLSVEQCNTMTTISLNSLQYSSSNNRNFVSDLRSSLNKFGTKISHQNPTAPTSISLNSKLSHSFSSSKLGSPEKRLSGNLNLEMNNNNSFKKPATEQKISKNDDEGLCPSPNRNIERSATISEFKAIQQRRAEWEQRARESFK